MGTPEKTVPAKKSNLLRFHVRYRYAGHLHSDMCHWDSITVDADHDMQAADIALVRARELKGDRFCSFALESVEQLL